MAGARERRNLGSVQLWRSALEGGALQSHVYPDVEPALRRFTEAGLRVYVFNSGSVEAQELLFLSDVVAELDAAWDAGMRAVQLLRPGVTPDPAGHHETAGTFDDIAGLPVIDAGSGAR